MVLRVLMWVVGIGIAVFGLLWLNAIRASGSRDQKLVEAIQPAIDGVKANRPDAAKLVEQLAANSVTRNQLYFALREFGKQDLVPQQWTSPDKMAESDLTRWLMHPNELGAPPAEMQLLRTIPVTEQQKQGTIYLFRFRTEPSHWAADKGWMIGIAGPYWENEPPVLTARDTFSELTPQAAMSIEQHLELIRTKLKQFGLTVRS